MHHPYSVQLDAVGVCCARVCNSNKSAQKQGPNVAGQLREQVQPRNRDRTLQDSSESRVECREAYSERGVRLHDNPYHHDRDSARDDLQPVGSTMSNPVFVMCANSQPNTPDALPNAHSSALSESPTSGAFGASGTAFRTTGPAKHAAISNANGNGPAQHAGIGNSRAATPAQAHADVGNAREEPYSPLAASTRPPGMRHHHALTNGMPATSTPALLAVDSVCLQPPGKLAVLRTAPKGAQSPGTTSEGSSLSGQLSSPDGSSLTGQLSGLTLLNDGAGAGAAGVQSDDGREMDAGDRASRGGTAEEGAWDAGLTAPLQAQRMGASRDASREGTGPQCTRDGGEVQQSSQQRSLQQQSLQQSLQSLQHSSQQAQHLPQGGIPSSHLLSESHLNASSRAATLTAEFQAEKPAARSAPVATLQPQQLKSALLGPRLSSDTAAADSDAAKAGDRAAAQAPLSASHTFDSAELYAALDRAERAGDLVTAEIDDDTLSIVSRERQHTESADGRVPPHEGLSSTQQAGVCSSAGTNAAFGSAEVEAPLAAGVARVYGIVDSFSGVISTVASDGADARSSASGHLSAQVDWSHSLAGDPFHDVDLDSHLITGASVSGYQCDTLCDTPTEAGNSAWSNALPGNAAAARHPPAPPDSSASAAAAAAHDASPPLSPVRAASPRRSKTAAPTHPGPTAVPLPPASSAAGADSDASAAADGAADVTAHVHTVLDSPSTKSPLRAAPSPSKLRQPSFNRNTPPPANLPNTHMHFAMLARPPAADVLAPSDLTGPGAFVGGPEERELAATLTPEPSPSQSLVARVPPLSPRVEGAESFPTMVRAPVQNIRTRAVHAAYSQQQQQQQFVHAGTTLSTMSRDTSATGTPMSAFDRAIDGAVFGWFADTGSSVAGGSPHGSVPSLSSRAHSGRMSARYHHDPSYLVTQKSLTSSLGLSSTLLDHPEGGDGALHANLKTC